MWWRQKCPGLRCCSFRAVVPGLEMMAWLFLYAYIFLRYSSSEWRNLDVLSTYVSCIGPFCKAGVLVRFDLCCGWQAVYLVGVGAAIVPGFIPLEDFTIFINKLHHSYLYDESHQSLCYLIYCCCWSLFSSWAASTEYWFNKLGFVENPSLESCKDYLMGYLVISYS